MNTNYTISTEELASIEQYLLGKGSAEERLAFENLAAANSEFASKVNEVKLLLAGIESASLKEKLDTFHNSVKKNPLQKEEVKPILWQRRLLMAASLALLAALSVWLYTQRESKYEKLYTAYYKPDPGLMSAMGVGDNYLFNRAMLDYKTGNYKKAITEWSKLKTTAAPNDTLEYFLGVAQQADGNNASALMILQSLTQNAANPFYKDACWYTGLALLKQGKYREAIPYLEKSGRAESNELISKIK